MRVSAPDKRRRYEIVRKKHTEREKTVDNR